MRTIDLSTGHWLNRPAHSMTTPYRLEIETEEGGDFWRQTHYGFERASGHALLFEVPTAFAAEIDFSGSFEQKYEQAGLLLWEDETRWIPQHSSYYSQRDR